jgi:hypothetical protein
MLANHEPRTDATFQSHIHSACLTEWRLVPVSDVETHVSDPEDPSSRTQQSFDAIGPASSRAIIDVSGFRRGERPQRKTE